MTQTDTPLQPIARRVALPTLPPWALVVIAVLSVQAGAAIAKSLFDTVGPVGVVFLRTALAGVMFLAVWRPSLRGYRRRDYGYLVLYGANIAGMMLAFYAAIDRVPLGVAVAISFAGPLGVAVLGSRRPIDFLWVGLAGLGILLLSPLANTKLDPIGVILSIGSAISWAIYIVLTKRVTQIFPGHVALAYSMGSAALLLLPFGAGGALKVLADPALILISLVVALLSSAIPFGLEFQALKHVSSRAFGLLVSLEPMVATVIGFVLLGERLELRALIGIVCVTIAAVATARESDHPNTRETEG